MSYIIQDSDPMNTGTYPDIMDIFPDGVQTKAELVDWLEEGFSTCKQEGITVNWVSYFTGYNAGAGTVYAISTDYANQIGYNGPTSAKTSNFILVTDKHIDQNLRELTVKGVKKMSKSFNDMVQKQRDKNIEKDIPYSYFDDGMEVGGELPTPMSKDEAEYHCLRNIGRYSPPEFIHAIFSLIADGDIKKYKELYIERFKQIFD